MAGRIFVTGASGFVGSAVLQELRSRDFSVNALVNQRSVPSLDKDIKLIKGDLFDDASLDAGVTGCDAVIHLVGIIAEVPVRGVTFEHIHYEGTKKMVDAARRAGVKRYLQMSAIGARANAPSNYHKTKFKAEEYVRASGLDFTIIRPSMIHGPKGEFMKMEAAWARKKAPPFVAMPYFGAGIFGMGRRYKIQPVFVNDVARTFVDAVGDAKFSGKTYEIGGPDQITWPQMHGIVASAVVGHHRWVLPFPARIARFYAAIGLGKLLHFNRDQVLMSQEDNTCDLTNFVRDFGWTPRPFEETVRSYAGEL